MVIIKSVRALLGLRKRLFSGGFGNGWSIVVTRNGRVAAKSLRMLDGTLSWAGAGKGFIMIYGQSDGRNLRSLCPMHLLLETSIENLSRFYTPEQACEIYSVYKRFNRIRGD
jgi:hypothetical protein